MTAQIHERLVYEGEDTSMAICPPIPKKHPRILLRDKDEIKSDEMDFILHTTACWRGYRGTWEIKDRRFYLIGLHGRIRIVGDEPIFADWFSGVIRIPRGEAILYVHMGFGTVYEKEIQVKIVEGIVKATRIVDNRNGKHDAQQLAMQNMPGRENRFPGDDGSWS